MQKGFFAFFVFFVLCASALLLCCSALHSSSVQGSAVLAAVELEHNSFKRFLLDRGTDFFVERAIVDSSVPNPDSKKIQRAIAGELSGFYLEWDGNFFECVFGSEQQFEPEFFKEFLDSSLDGRFKVVVLETAPSVFLVKALFSAEFFSNRSVCSKLSSQNSFSYFFLPPNYSISRVVS